ncbi:hypothetical protein I306_00008 [Cryptococcus gattii EJB2]|uniref:Uncharacterized protein n=1 Tax=Cryptococcus gattii EJB2 TaxID=1296103 RepID=A0ABR5C4B7_9TREE|nr:hypothetical protein I306_00008 [Cryptococcus gattii EJB2]
MGIWDKPRSVDRLCHHLRFVGDQFPGVVVKYDWGHK